MFKILWQFSDEKQGRWEEKRLIWSFAPVRWSCWTGMRETRTSDSSVSNAALWEIILYEATLIVHSASMSSLFTLSSYLHLEMLYPPNDGFYYLLYVCGSFHLTTKKWRAYIIFFWWSFFFVLLWFFSAHTHE